MCIRCCLHSVRLSDTYLPSCIRFTDIATTCFTLSRKIRFPLSVTLTTIAMLDFFFWFVAADSFVCCVAFIFVPNTASASVPSHNCCLQNDLCYSTATINDLQRTNRGRSDGKKLTSPELQTFVILVFYCFFFLAYRMIGNSHPQRKRYPTSTKEGARRWKSASSIIALLMGCFHLHPSLGLSIALLLHPDRLQEGQCGGQ